MDVVSILQKMEELHLIRLHRIVGDYYQIYCPIHNDGNERNPSCGVLINEQVRDGQVYPQGFTHCFACNLAVTLPELVSQILKLRNIASQSGIEWLKENIPGFDEGESNFDYLLPRDLVKKLNNEFAMSYIKKKTQTATTYVTEEELAKYRYTIDYMYERKLTDEIIAKFDVGVDLHYVPDGKVREVPTITFPVKDLQGNVLFIYRRAIKTKNFYMPANIEKPVYGIYELPKGCRRVVLCESIFNALTCWVYGMPALALLGTGTTKQIDQLKLLGVAEFVCGFDPDDAGIRGTNKIRRALSRIAIVKSMELPTGSDINDLSKEEFEKIFNKRF